MGSHSDSTAPGAGRARRSAGSTDRRATALVDRIPRALAGRRHRGPLGSLAAMAFVGLLLSSVAAAGTIVLPEADLRISGAVVEGPDAGGIDTGSTMRYRITVHNDGPNPIPAGGLLLVLSVDRSDSSALATMEVARFNDGGGLQPAPGGGCGNGRRVLVQCTNRQVLQPGQEIDLDIGHRHPEEEAGTLSFVAQTSLSEPTINDPVPGNNSYRGPSYQFQIQPSTTTTSTTSTTADTTTTSDSSSTTIESSTTTSSTTTTTISSTTTTPSTTSTTEAPTTVTETSLAALSGSATLPPGPTSSLVTPATVNEQLVLGQSGDVPSDSAPPYLLLAVVAAGVLVLGGAAMAAYAYLNRPPPLVDMRHFD